MHWQTSRFSHDQAYIIISVEYQEVQKRTAELQTKSAAKVKDLENKIKNAKAIREKELKDAEDGVNKAKKKMAESSKKMKEKYQVIFII